MPYGEVVTDRYRTLLLLRHAKSDYPAGVADHDRPLAARGVREAALAGDWLRAHTPAVDAVLCSTATRTRETLARTRIEAPVSYVDRLYDATPGAVIEEINGVDSGRGDPAGDRPRAGDVIGGARPCHARWQQQDCGRTHLDEVPDLSDRGVAHRAAVGRADAQQRRTGHLPRAALNALRR